MNGLVSCEMDKRINLGHVESIPKNTKKNKIATKWKLNWEGPFIIIEIFPYGAVEIKEESSNSAFKVNGHRLLIFNENQDMINKTIDEMNLTSPAYLPP